jgi:FAS-associated factor 2
LIYIHQNDNKDCHSFATETLNNQELIDYMRTSFLFWSCSKNLPEGLKVFKALKAKRCPFLGIILLKNARMTLVSRIEGPINAAELMIELTRVTAENEGELNVVRMEREQRAQNQLLRQQQDQAYMESLKADKEKARKKQEIEEAKRMAEELEKKKLEEEKARANVI